MKREWKCSKLCFSKPSEREYDFSLGLRGDPIVEILWDKKEGCSMQRGQRVGTGFKEFQKTS